MTDAFKKIFLGLGGDPKELAENNDVGDYILDLESAIKKTASDVINDAEASDDTTYSSNKIESLIPEVKDPEYLKVSFNNVNGPVSVRFPDGYDRASFYAYAHKKPVICDFMLSFNNWSIAMYGKISLSSISDVNARDGVICFRGLTRNDVETDKSIKYLVTVIISQSDPTKDQVFYEELTT